MIDFAALPPEVNSARMYMGPGSGPMLSAATAWSALSTSLADSATETHTLVAGLEGVWHGPSSEEMAAKVSQHVAWLSETSAHAARTAAQAHAAAAAYEAAFAATVPPPQIAANRALLAALVASNILGQNIAAITATETQYMEIWAQDVEAMSMYAASSQQATALDAIEPPPSGSTTPGSTTPPTTPLSDLWSYLLGGQTLPELFWTTTQSGLSSGPYESVPSILSLLTGLWAGTTAASVLSSVSNAVAPSSSPLSFLETTPTAAIGGSTSIGGLSVPTSWGSATPTSTTVPTTPLPTVTEEGGAPMGGVMPMGAKGSREEIHRKAKWGNRMTVLPTERVF